MFAKFIIAALLSITAATPGIAQGAKKNVATAATPAPDDRARQWLVLVDDKNYTQSWAQAGTAFKNRQKADAWAKDELAKREPLGAVASRSLKSIDLSRNTLAVIRYDTVFAHKASALETVTMAFENGSWVVTEYSIS
jgi:hypothetical protein